MTIKIMNIGRQGDQIVLGVEFTDHLNTVKSTTVSFSLAQAMTMSVEEIMEAVRSQTILARMNASDSTLREKLKTLIGLELETS